MKKFIIFLFTASIFLSCNKRTDPEALSSTSVTIVLLNKQGQNLLSSSSNSNLTEYTIQAFSFKDGQSTLFYEPTAVHPNGFMIGKTNNNEPTLLLFAFNAFGKTTEFSTSLITLGSYGTDTVKCQRATTNRQTRVMKVWYNGVLKFDAKVAKTEPIFTVIK